VALITGGWWGIALDLAGAVFTSTIVSLIL